MVREGLILTVGGTVTLTDLVMEVATVEETVTAASIKPIAC